MQRKPARPFAERRARRCALRLADIAPLPERTPTRCARVSAHCTRWSPTSLRFGHGSNELIDLIVPRVRGPDEHAVIGTPSFACYRLCLHAADVPTTKVPLDRRFVLECRAHAARRCGPTPKLMFLDNPATPPAHISAARSCATCCRQLPRARRCPSIDEAYVHFADAPDYASALSCARSRRT